MSPVARAGWLRNLDAFAAHERRLGRATASDFYGSLPASRRFASLLLDAAALRGFDVGGDAARGSIAAGELVLRNRGNPAALTVGDGSGGLRLAADRLELAGGEMAWSGFDRVTLEAPEVLVRGRNQVTSATAVDVLSGAIGTRDGGRLTFDVAGELRLLGAGSGSDPYRMAAGRLTKDAAPAAGLGGRIDLRADAIVLASAIRLPSGTIELTARTGDVRLAAGAVLDVAGLLRRFDTRLTGTEGGRVSLRAAAGDVVLEAGSVIDVAGTALGARTVATAGELDLRAPAGRVVLGAGRLIGGYWAARTGGSLALLDPTAETAAQAGRLTLEVARVGAGGFAFADYAASGFVGALELRLREGDLSIAADTLVSATAIGVAVDRGRFEVAGTLDASAPEGGRLELAAGSISSSADLRAAATAPARAGGSLELASRDGRSRSQTAPCSMSVGGRRAAPPAQTAVRIIAARGSDNASVAVDPLLGSVLGAARIEVIANRVYDGIARIDATETAAATQIGLDTLRAHNEAFGLAAPGLAAALDPDGAFGARLHVMPGIEIRSTAGSPLELTTDWALATWRAGDAPGLLTLRAGGNLVLNGGLDDGIVRRDNLQALTNFSFDPAEFGKVDMLLDGLSWSYRLGGCGSESAASKGRAGYGGVHCGARRPRGDLHLANNRRVRRHRQHRDRDGR